jgi:hypothetical protein
MAIILVPTDQPNIASAIAAVAPSGDEIELEKIGSPFQGANNKNLDPSGKNFLIRGETGNPVDIVIDCQNSGNAFNMPASNIITMEGFTIQNGDKGDGGGIYTRYGALYLNNMIIKDCSSLYKGGGLCAIQCTAVLTNCLIIGNYCENLGGGLFTTLGANLTVNNSAITGNQGCTGGGFRQQGTSDVSVFNNCIIYGNTVNPPDENLSGRQIYKYGGTCTVNYCNHANQPGDIYGAIVHNNCQHDQDPLWVAGPDGNYYLSQIAAGQGVDSPCVNAGSDTAAALGMDTKTTRTDEVTDTGQVDIGWHYETAIANKAAMLQVTP